MYLIQVWLRCDHEGCDAMAEMAEMAEMLAPLKAVVNHRHMRLPPGWTHHGYDVDPGSKHTYRYIRLQKVQSKRDITRL